MSKSSSKKPKQSQPAVPLSPVDALFSKYSENYQTQSQKTIHWVCVVVIIFSLLGISWAAPFPHLDFLKNYNGFFNWSSFLIAALIYYYYRLMPTLSFVMFVVLFVFAYGITKMADWQNAGGPPLLVISAVLFIAAAVLQFSNLKLKGKSTTFLDWLKFMIISPLWVLHFVFRKKAN
ncbi:MAG: hypothetical protein ACTHMI_01900 [Mucilaginibacter sp.]